MIETLKDLLKSKKALAAIVGILLTAYGDKLGITADKIPDLIKLILTYIGAQGIADFQKSATLANLAAAATKAVAPAAK